MDSCDVAWAAGFFDAEGSISHHLPKHRKTRRPTLDVSQSGGASPPSVLLRFREVIGRGSIFGPYRGYLYYWRTHDAGLISSVIALLWPWLSDEKRDQIRSTLMSVPALWCAELLGDVWQSHVETRERLEEQRAWAAGFFDGDGSVGAYAQRTSSSSYLVLSASVSQAAAKGVPTSLSRFNEAVGVGGICGPYGPRGWSRLPQYRWQVKGHRVELAIERLRPWMESAKRDQADEAIQAARSSFAQRHLASRPEG